VALPLLTAVTGVWEAPLVSALERAPGVEVVRRCADLAELVAAARAGHGRAALLSADLRGVDRTVLARLAATGVAVVGVTGPPGDPGSGEQSRRLQALGVRHAVPADADGAAVAASVAAAVEDLASREAGAAGTGDPAAALAGRPGGAWGGAGEDDEAPGEAGTGRLVAVWGAAGAPGRTTVATTLATELAALVDRRGEGDALLADADTWSASTAQVLGLLDESAGIAAACRAAATGALTSQRLAALAPPVLPGLRVLTGLPRSSRWPELSAVALDDVWAACRALAPWTVVDCAASLEADEELSFDTAAPRRNAAALSAVEAADTVLAVGSADPVGLQRLVRALGELSGAVPSATPLVVVNRVRASAVGPAPGERVREALARYAGVEDVVLVPDDRPATDAALLAGRTLTETAPGSPARLALADLAARLAEPARADGVADGHGRGGPGGRARRWPWRVG